MPIKSLQRKEYDERRSTFIFEKRAEKTVFVNTFEFRGAKCISAEFEKPFFLSKLRRFVAASDLNVILRLKIFTTRISASEAEHRFRI